MISFSLWLVGVLFYAVLGFVVFSISPALFWLLLVAATIRAFIKAGPLTAKSRNNARRQQNRLAAQAC